MDSELKWTIRLLRGVLGGVVAVGSKYIAQDHYWVRVLIDTREYDQIPGLIYFYSVLLFVLCLIGGVFAVASEENKKMKLLAIAVSAPALITTWLGGARADASAFTNGSRAALISQALADDGTRPNNSAFWQGFLLPLGYGKDDSRYRVVVGSFTNRTEAALLAEKIKKENPSLTVFVGEPQPSNPYSPVIVGGYLPYPEASKLKESISGLSSVKDVKDIYLSPYKYR